MFESQDPFEAEEVKRYLESDNNSSKKEIKGDQFIKIDRENEDLDSIHQALIFPSMVPETAEESEDEKCTRLETWIKKKRRKRNKTQEFTDKIDRKNFHSTKNLKKIVMGLNKTPKRSKVLRSQKEN